MNFPLFRELFHSTYRTTTIVHAHASCLVHVFITITSLTHTLVLDKINDTGA